MSSTCEQIVRQLVEEVWNQGHTEVLDEILVDVDQPSDPSVQHGRDAAVALIGKYHDLFPGYHLNIDEILAGGETVAAKVTSEGTVLDKQFGVLPRERTVAHRFYLVHHFTQCPDGNLTAIESVPELSQLCRPESPMSWLEKGLSSLTSQPVFRHAVLIVFLVASLLFLLRHFSAYGKGIANEWLEPDNQYWLSVPGLGEVVDRHYSATDMSGRYMTFVSNNDSLVVGDDNNTLDVFVYDRETDVIRLISMSRPRIRAGDCIGDASDGWSIHPSISADGRYVVFRSNASNIPRPPYVWENKKDDDGQSAIGNIYIHDMKACETLLLPEYIAQQTETNSDVEAAVVRFEEPDAALPELWWLGASHYERARLLQQHERVRALAQRHLTIVAYYYVQTFAAITLATISALCAAVALLFITRSGWSKANSYVVTLFVVLTASTILFTVLPNLFSYSRNIEANKARYVSYAALENQVWSYITTGHLTNVTGSEDERLSPKEFILHVDSQLVKMTNLPLELNPEAIPDISNVLKELTNPQSFIKQPDSNQSNGDSSTGQ